MTERDDIAARLRAQTPCIHSDPDPRDALLIEAAARIEQDALKIAALKGEVRGLRYNVRVAQLDKDEGAPEL